MNLFGPIPVRTSRWTRTFVAVTPWLAYAAIAAVMLKWTWLGWADPIVDFGVEIYSAWQISEGSHLYRDIAYHFGPLPAYWNGLWFAILGPSYHLLFLLNFLVAAAVFFLLHRILSVMAHPCAVFAAMTTFLLLFLCAQYVGIGNENFMAPYRHGLTHGFLCSLAALWMAYRWLQNRRTYQAVCVGILLGLAGLTKPETAIAGLGATATVFLAHIWPQRRLFRCYASTLLAAAFGLLLPIFAAWLFLSAHMSYLVAWDGIIRPWRDIAQSMPQLLPYHQWVMGIDHPLRNSIRILKWCALYAAIFSIPLVASQRLSQKSALYLSLLFGLGLICAAFFIPFDWIGFASPWPVFMFIGIALLTRRVARQNNPQNVLQLAFLVFAFLSLLKMILNVQIYHYGFVLALPATLGVIVLILDWFPTHLKRNKSGVQFVALCLLGLVVSFHLSLMIPFQRDKRTWVGQGGDLICMDNSRGRGVMEFLQKAGAYIPPGSSLAVMPEGASLNYLLRLTNSTPFTSLDPNTMALEQESRMLAAYQKNPPDFIALAPNDYSVFNLRFFGIDYANTTGNWIQEHYNLVLLDEPYPIENDACSIYLLKRRALEHLPDDTPGDDSR